MSMASKRKLPSHFDIDMTPLHDFMRNLDSFFNHSFKQMNEHFHFNPFWLDVKEHNTHFTIEADLKGYNKDQIQIEVAGNRIRIAVQDYHMMDQKDTKKQYRETQQRYSKKERVISLPFDIPKKDIKASFNKDRLNITIPKPKTDHRFIEIEDS